MEVSRRSCAGSTSLGNIDRTLKGSSTCQVIARNSSSFLGFKVLPKGLSFPKSLRRQEGRRGRRVPSALLDAHEYRKQQLEKVFLKEMGSDTFENDDDGDLCPIECVREISKLSELENVIEDSKNVGALLVVDFFRTSCGSCRYIEKGFQKLCKGAGNGEASVIFLKHNVVDEYDEQSDIAEKFRIKVRNFPQTARYQTFCWLCHCSIFTRMESLWNPSQLATKLKYCKPSTNTWMLIGQSKSGVTFTVSNEMVLSFLDVSCFHGRIQNLSSTWLITVHCIFELPDS